MGVKQRDDIIRQAVRESYRKIAERGAAGCGCNPSSCCSGPTEALPQEVSVRIGYTKEDIQSIPDGADMGLGCGNPLAIAKLRPGESVLDLGSGGGFDCFLAAKRVGETGQVIGVDMTAEMVAKSRENARKGGYTNVDFRLGEIEHLPLADASVDVVISNCVINLSPDKPSVFRETFRVLKPGGRLTISDVVATAHLPEDIRNDLALYSGCISGAVTVAELRRMITDAGFQNVQIQSKDESREYIRDWAPGRNIESYIVSATIEAEKPRA